MIPDAPGGLLRTIVAILEAARIPHMVVPTRQPEPARREVHLHS